ncbi:hypothetical protein CGMCC3_g8495 [Colletotrichum fructicola]|nr:uncharacterized protein CGMCC3_g8495 [Colletotrichum fructicola]KAE9575599.1 hypothetical protein CGMCC3_g8495 [Colletotrichum fructicola]
MEKSGSMVFLVAMRFGQTAASFSRRTERFSFPMSTVYATNGHPSLPKQYAYLLPPGLAGY